MKIIKRDGRIQEISTIKIRNSILGASIDSNTIINEADLNILANSVMKILKEIRGKEGTTSSYEVLGVVVEALEKDGFSKIANAYLGLNK